VKALSSNPSTANKFSSVTQAERGIAPNGFWVPWLCSLQMQVWRLAELRARAPPLTQAERENKVA
jgi:hypothetical protein